MDIKIDSELILEMFNRIKKLETDVANLKSKNFNPVYENPTISKNMTRKMARKKVLNKLQEANLELFNFHIATRKGGSGIRFEYKDKSNKNMSYPMYAKFYFRNITGTDSQHYWFTVSKKDIDEIRNTVPKEEENYNIEILIFFGVDEETNEELLIILPGINVFHLINFKGVDSFDANEMYHFYFKKSEDGKTIEFRDNKIDVSKCANNYSLLSEYYLFNRSMTLVEKIDNSY